MTNEALQKLIGSWFPNPKTEEKPEVNLEQESQEISKEEQKTATPINPSLLEFTEEGSQFLNIIVQPDHLHSLMSQLKNNEHQIVVKVKTADRENPNLDSVCDIWRTAEFHEREVFDFFGIKFNNHPNLKRLFLTENWEGFPLRKDYVDEVNMIIK